MSSDAPALIGDPQPRRVARVAVDIPLAHLDRLFDYSVPEKLAADAVAGARVRVPFSGRIRDGWLVSFGEGRDGRSGSRPRLDEASRGQLVVGRDDRAPRDGQLGREHPRRGERVPWSQSSLAQLGDDRVRDAVPQRPVGGVEPQRQAGGTGDARHAATIPVLPIRE